MVTYDFYLVANEALWWQILSKISIYHIDRWTIKNFHFYDDILVS